MGCVQPRSGRFCSGWIVPNVLKIHPLQGNKCTKLHCNPSNRCWYIWIWTKVLKQLTTSLSMSLLEVMKHIQQNKSLLCCYLSWLIPTRQWPSTLSSWSPAVSLPFCTSDTHKRFGFYFNHPLYYSIKILPNIANLKFSCIRNVLDLTISAGPPLTIDLI